MSVESDQLLSWVTIAVVVFVFLSLVCYFILGLRAFLGRDAVTKEILLDNVAGNIGVPAAAIAAFALVTVFWKLFPPPKGGELQIRVFSLVFSGPSGPIGLWIACFLSFVLAIWLFRLPRRRPRSSPNTSLERTRGR